uniref:Uncharacterized protein n=1 Tax=Oryza brachyantha TaxID=4533 RepID=J3NCJ1_ORYBR
MYHHPSSYSNVASPPTAYEHSQVSMMPLHYLYHFFFTSVSLCPSPYTTSHLALLTSGDRNWALFHHILSILPWGLGSWNKDHKIVATLSPLHDNACELHD